MRQPYESQKGGGATCQELKVRCYIIIVLWRARASRSDKQKRECPRMAILEDRHTAKIARRCISKNGTQVYAINYEPIQLLAYKEPN